MPHSTQEKPYDFEDFLSYHKPQLGTYGIPEIYWTTLFGKLKDEVLDAGGCFSIMKVLYEDSDDENDDNAEHGWKVIVSNENGINSTDPQHIYLIDHAWTYRMDSARSQLQSMPQLLDRLVNLMEIEKEDKNNEELVDAVLHEMWGYNQSYNIANAAKGTEEAMPIWYIMDEFGSRIQHSDEPSFRTVPFYYAPMGLTFTLLWPVKNLENGDEVTRNFVEVQCDLQVRKAKLLPWVESDFSAVSFEQEEPSTEYFASHRMNENLPNLDMELACLSKDRNLKVYTDDPLTAQFLTDTRFQLVKTIEEADIVWLNDHYKQFRELSENQPGTLINQFPFEMVVNVKDLLAVVSRRAAPPSGPKWLPVTYNLVYELPKFVAYYKWREEQGLDNHWICKPWNLARALDTYVTNNLNCIVRLPDTGPKVACKYIEDPVLFYRDDVGLVKFDFRYVIFLSSVKPLKLYAHTVFWLRFANQEYSLDKLDVYEKHFTVMNYQEAPLKQVNHDEFIQLFDRQYPNFSWCKIEEDVFQTLIELFEAASSEEPPKGIGRSPQSRALYAVDMMVKWDKNEKGEKVIQPMILEVNYAPDNKRACQYVPDFVNDVFSTLFLDDIEGRPVVQIV